MKTCMDCKLVNKELMWCETKKIHVTVHSEICKKFKGVSEVKIKKYTLERTNEDIQKLEKIRNYLKKEYKFSLKRFNTDSEIYRNLPDLFFNAVKKIEELRLANELLTAKDQERLDLIASICRILQICDIQISTKDNPIFDRNEVEND